MRRYLAIVLLALFSLSMATVNAAPVESLNALARFYPTDSWVYGAIRTDDDFVASLDAIVQNAIEYAPPGMIPPISLGDGLDIVTEQFGGSSFADDIRPWLGEVAAVGFTAPTTDDIFADPLILISVQITDKDTAMAFVGNVIAANFGIEVAPKSNGFVDVIQANANTFFAFSDDMMFITNDTMLVSGNMDSTLADDANFAESFALLPESDYNITAYVNTLAINQYTLSTIGEDEIPGVLLNAVRSLTELNKGQAIGATILDGDNLVIDVAVNNNLEPLADFGITLNYDIEPIDLAFANRVPADAPLVVMGTNPGTAAQTSLDSIRQFSDWINEQGGIGTLVNEIDPFFSEEEMMALNAIDLSLILGLVNAPFAGFTGLSLERDVLAALDGNSATFLRARTVDDFFFPVLPDIGILFETSDVDSGLNIVDTLTESAMAYDLAVETESYGEGRALVFPTDLVNINYSNLDLLIGASDGVLSIGSRPAVEGALNTATGLADNPTFQAASDYFLPDSYQILYASGDPVYEILDFVIETRLIPTNDDVAIAYRLGSIVESASVSATSSADGSQGVARFVLSLSDQPREFPEMQ